MRGQDFTLAKGDTYPPLKVRALDEHRNPIDLTSIEGGVDTVTFTMKQVDTQDTVVDKSTALAVTPSDGVIAYEWTDGDTDTAGQHRGWFEITFNSGKSGTFPNSDAIDIYIGEQ